MAENGEVGSQESERRVRIERLPEYEEMRRLLDVWHGRPTRQVRGLYKTLSRLSTEAQHRLDWTDPDTWISERVADEDRSLALATWTESRVNPRYTGDHWRLARSYEFLVDDADGKLELTERGRDFVDHESGGAVAFLDEQEGLTKLLAIVAEAGPARSSALQQPWAEYLGRYSGYGSPSTINSTLSSRLKHLYERKLIHRVIHEGVHYSITEAGREYLKRRPPAPPPVSVQPFSQLTRFLSNQGLLFSPDIVANYILALQTKRFAILTGISGTGKTKIAKAVAQRFQVVLKQRIAKVPEDAVELQVMPYMLKYSRFMLPAALKPNLNLHGPDMELAKRQIGVRYPGKDAFATTTLAYNQDKRGATAILFRGQFKTWFRSKLEGGDRFWVRVREHDEDVSEASGIDQLEIGIPETEEIEQPITNYAIIPVRPDWVDNRGLLGYLNPLTNEYSTTLFLKLLLEARKEEQRAEAAGEKPHPFFVILDEMNLARVEHYFSDFLSALESGEPISLHEDEAIERGEAESGPQVPRRLQVPGNVLFTGTVNVDETTFMFSPKVLDRAFTIEFNQVDLAGFAAGQGDQDNSVLNLDGEQGALNLLRSTGGSGSDDWRPGREEWKKFSKDCAKHYHALLRLHRILEAQHRHFGYRVANEIARFVNLAREQAADAQAAADAAFDLALLQKVLPKFHGTQQELESLLEWILHFAVYGGASQSKANQDVELTDWRVEAGHLTATSKGKAQWGGADAKAEESESGDATSSESSPQTPAYPRTGAKVLRMLHRLRDRGFTSFIE